MTFSTGTAGFQDVLSAWSLTSPMDIQPITAGSNNLTYAVDTSRERYILRIYQNTAESDDIIYEHLLLAHLHQAGLSFAVPAPIPTRYGSTLLTVPDGFGRKLAALFPRIPGRQPDGDELGWRRSCGAALAELDQALSSITIPAPPVLFPRFGDFSQLHPDVSDLFSMLEQIPMERDHHARLTRIVGDLLAALPILYASLPQQIVHRDFDASNVLMEGDRVSGVLDFEFAGPDLRALDLARSVAMFTISPWSIPDGWQLVAAFIMGYREHVKLTAPEVEALPDMMRLYRVRSLVHWEGRRRKGLASAEDVQAHANGLLRQDDWLNERRRDLVRLLAP